MVFEVVFLLTHRREVSLQTGDKVVASGTEGQ